MTDLSDKWYEVIKLKNNLYIIRERLDLIDPRWHTTYINMYLIIGARSALLFDTGCGLFPIKPIIEDIIKNKELLIVNSHYHFDHIGGNAEFSEVFIHENEQIIASRPLDISFFVHGSPMDIINKREVGYNFFSK